MVDSPKGRNIEWIEGDPGAIAERGVQIVQLGDQMIGSAGVLKAVADGASGMEGLSVDKLREVVGDVHEQLKLAGERYTPTGWALRRYADVLDDVQLGLRALVEDCEAHWGEYSRQATIVGDLEWRRGGSMPGDAGAGEADGIEEELGTATTDRDRAYSAWQEDAEAYDERFDTWEAAFDRATNEIGDATDGGISDSWRDDVAGFASTALKVLQIAGMVLAVLAIIVGGPIIAFLATVVGILTLIATLYMKYYGRASWGDVAVAVIGVIPFSKLPAVFAGAPGAGGSFFKAMVGADDAIKGWGQLSSGWQVFRSGFSTAGLTGFSRFAGGASEVWPSVARQIGDPADWVIRSVGAGDHLASTLDNLADPVKYWDVVDGLMAKPLSDTVSSLAGAIWAPSEPAPDLPVDSWRDQLAASTA
ncbi:hypothetical protein J7E25_05995 [Agromyces sp. ISL-38]|uniref:hypothetical protein n=1 Tax=Agromyces sp. ISL-38 TaxID=2819107 RepID=UPI001BEBF8F9|nr:hypothetical protein [Agromyces sp. ISL-38]MBT2498641.1 hypothetical protein [Agromyces sp. ISL-38]